MRLLLALMTFLLLPAAAAADCYQRPYRATTCGWGGCTERIVYRTECTRAAAAPAAGYYAPPHGRMPSLGPKCAAEVVATGSQALTIDGARRNAEDAWAGIVRSSPGEQYLDLDYAKDVRHMCWRSTIAETSVLSKALYRCRVWAIPCRPEVEDIERKPHRSKGPPDDVPPR